MKRLWLILIASVALAQGTKINPTQINWATSFSSPPQLRLTNTPYLFVDALTTGNCVGGGSSFAWCVWTGSAWAPASSGTGGSFTALTGDATSTSTGGATTVLQLQGGVIPTSAGVVGTNSSKQLVAATSGSIVALFSSCSGSQYLGADGACHTASGGSGYVVITTGGGTPSANCTAPSTTNLAEYIDSTNGDIWWCYAANSWKKILSVTGSGPYQVMGATGSAPITPANGYVTCYFGTSGSAQVCLDSGGNAWAMLPPSGTAIANSTTGNAATATVLATTPSLCSTGYAPTGILASGNATGCASIGGGGGTSWPAGLVYYGGTPNGSFPPVGSGGSENMTPLVGATYCQDSYDISITPSAIIMQIGVTGSYYAVISVLSPTGTVELTTGLNVGGGESVQKFPVSSTTVPAGGNSWCIAIESGASSPLWYGWTHSTIYAYNPGAYPLSVSGAPVNWYSCSIAPTGSGASFAIPQYGNCPSGHGTRTALLDSPGPPFMLAYQ